MLLTILQIVFFAGYAVTHFSRTDVLQAVTSVAAGVIAVLLLLTLVR